MPTVQSQAIQNANTITQLAAQLLNLYIAIQNVSNAWTDDGTANAINAFPTAPQNTDGSLGTADTTPNNAHPIDTRVSQFTALQRTLSANQYASTLTILQNVVNYVNGQAVAATPGVRGILNQATGG